MKYPIGVQSFESLRDEGFVYVDKTDLIYNLVQKSKYVFLSRPRRFGKSLLLSTIEAYFQGKKHLFEGLAMDRLEKEWRVHPVIHIDLNIGEYKTIGDLDERLNVLLGRYERLYGTDPTEKSFGSRFEGVIQRAYQKSGLKTVVLIDEYDKPILNTIGDKKLQDALRDRLRSFYEVLKTADPYLRFTMLTGVTKFSKLSVFSGLNNLDDISFDVKYSTLCGITKQEILSIFDKPIAEMAKVYGMDIDTILEQLRHTYDGYRFSMGEEKVFNPFSLLCALSKERMSYFWFSTGTPRYLVKLLQMHHYDIASLEGAVADEERLSSVDTDSSDPIPIIYQSGYLTIKEYNPKRNRFVLGYPNDEVRIGFLEYLLPFYASRRMDNFDVDRFTEDIESGRAEDFMKRLIAFTADISYEIQVNCENDFQNLLYIIFALSSLHPVAEKRTSDGRIDMVVETDHYVYVMEYKIDGTAEEAMDQIESKNYTLPWSVDHRHVIKIGVNFSTERRRITEYVIR